MIMIFFVFFYYIGLGAYLGVVCIFSRGLRLMDMGVSFVLDFQHFFCLVLRTWDRHN